MADKGWPPRLPQPFAITPLLRQGKGDIRWWRVTVDLCSATTLYEQKAWSTGSLAPGKHTVKIEWKGCNRGAWLWRLESAN
jgi:hypothetical protein